MTATPARSRKRPGRNAMKNKEDIAVSRRFFCVCIFDREYSGNERSFLSFKALHYQEKGLHYYGKVRSLQREFYLR